MNSFGETVQIFAVALVISVPWIFAIVLAVRGISRKPSRFTYLLTVVVVVGGPPVAFVYFAYRIWRGVAPNAQQDAAQSLPAAHYVA